MSTFKSLSTLLFLSSLLFAQNNFLSPKELQAFKSYKALASKNLTILEGVDEGDTYFLKIQYQKLTKKKILYAFVNKKSQRVSVGTRYEKDGSESVFPKSPEAIEQIEEGVFFSFGTGKKEIYMVTDPDCIFCKRFEKATQGKLGKKYRVHVIYQVFSFHKKSPAMVSWIMQGKDEREKQRRMEAIMVEGSKGYLPFLKKDISPQMKEQIAKGLKASQALEAMGSPMFYDTDFKLIDTGELVQKLGK